MMVKASTHAAVHTAPAPSLSRTTPRITITPDALGARVHVDGDVITGRELMSARSKALGRYTHPDQRQTSNIIAQPSLTNERFTEENGAAGLVFHKSADFTNHGRLVEALGAMGVDHLITGDRAVAELAQKAAIPTTVVNPKSPTGSAPLEDSPIFARANAQRRAVRALNVAFSPGVFNIDGKVAPGIQNTARFILAHTGRHVIDADGSGKAMRAYTNTIMSHGNTEGAHDLRHIASLAYDAHQKFPSSEAVLKALTANPPDLFLTDEPALAQSAMERGVLAGIPTRTPLRLAAGNANKPFTFAFDFDGVTINRDTEGALMKTIDADPKYGRATAWGNEGRRALEPRKPGPALGLLKAVAHNAEHAANNADQAEIMTSRPNFAAGTVRTTLQHNNVKVAGVTIIDEGSKGAQMEHLKGVLLDDSAYKVKDAEAKGQPAILVPILPDAQYAVFKKFGPATA